MMSLREWDVPNQGNWDLGGGDENIYRAPPRDRPYFLIWKKKGESKKKKNAFSKNARCI